VRTQQWLASRVLYPLLPSSFTYTCRIIANNDGDINLNFWSLVLNPHVFLSRIFLPGCILFSLAAVAGNVPEEHSTRSFLAADTNSDGVVDEAEFGADVAASFAAVDSNHDGRLSADEIGPDLYHEIEEEDLDGDGYIDMSEVIEVKARAFNIADKDDNGMLELHETIEYDSTLDFYFK
jgi:hypothetical protein